MYWKYTNGYPYFHGTSMNHVYPFEYSKVNRFFGMDITMDIAWILQPGKLVVINYLSRTGSFVKKSELYSALLRYWTYSQGQRSKFPVFRNIKADNDLSKTSPSEICYSDKCLHINHQTRNEEKFISRGLLDIK